MSDDGLHHHHWSLKKAATIFMLAAFLALAAKPLPAQNAGPARDAWQHPEEVMDALGVHRGSAVADVGSGEGYFTFHLADRVGPTGHVYAVDIEQSHLDVIQREAAREGLKQISTILGAPDDPHLSPNSLDFVLAVDTYHEWHDYTAMLHHLFLALKPGGIFGLMDGAAPAGHPRDYYYERHRMPEQMERTEVVAAGFRFVRRERGMTRPSDGKQFYYLIFQKPQ
ncbi:MAG TPA: methyltransferase domain-containing protein [Terriglobia bacterium]|nr:methyltransferase domain-containing protein [Terriglobia bacterium]